MTRQNPFVILRKRLRYTGKNQGVHFSVYFFSYVKPNVGGGRMKNRVLLFLCVLMMFLVCVEIVHAEERESKIYLKNGDIVTGVVLEQQANVMKVKTKYGTSQIMISDVQKIDFDEKAASKAPETADDGFKKQKLAYKLQSKSRLVAGLFSFVVPGCGQYYVGNYGESDYGQNTTTRGAIYTSMFVAGLAVYLDAPKKDSGRSDAMGTDNNKGKGQRVAGGSIAILSMITSSIGAVMTASDHNQELAKRLQITFDFDPVAEEKLLMLSYRF